MAGEQIDKLFKELHKTELDRKYQHESLDSFLLAIVTVLGGIDVYWSKLVPTDNWTLVGVAFVGSIIMGCIFCHYDSVLAGLASAVAAITLGVVWWIAVQEAAPWSALGDGWLIAFRLLFGWTAGKYVLALGCLVMSIWPKDMEYTSEADVFHDFFEGELAHFEAVNPGTGLDEAEKSTREQLRKQHAACATTIRRSNLIKTKWQVRCRYLVAFTVVFVVLNAVPTLVVQMRQQLADSNHVNSTSGQTTSR